MNKTLLLLLLLSTIARADQPTAASIAAATTADVLTAGLHSPDALTRATAARVATVRNVAELLPQIREMLATEKDGVAAREEIRALALLGNDADVTAAAAQSAKWPAPMDDALADAIARRGNDALDLYHSTLADSRMATHTEFFRQLLWPRSGMLPVVASRVLGWHDSKAWKGLLRTAFDSEAAMPAGVMTASVGVPEDEIRFASIWYLVRGYAVDPASIKDPLRAALLEPREAGPDREDFGRELLRRMLGGERKDDERWLKFLESDDADQLLQNESQNVLQYFTDAEYRVRHNRCAVQSAECKVTKTRPLIGRAIPGSAVAPPPFILPSLLPAGLADAIINDAHCKDEWVGVALATVDAAGRVKELDLSHIEMSGRCRDALATVIRMSLASPLSLRSDFSGSVILARGRDRSLCINEPPPSERVRLLHAGGEIKPPIVKRRVEPAFPHDALAQMGGGAHVLVIAECVISREGCVRSIRLLKKAPFADINGAALLALSEWTFVPGYLDGKPVDVIFNLTVNFQAR